MEVRESVHEHMFTLATQYYASGRFATLNGMKPVCGNLLHHAVEMFLKGALARRIDLKELRELGHNLNMIWLRTKSEFPKVELSPFDLAIQNLDRFERIRYPDDLIKKGATVHIDIHRNEWVPTRENHTGPKPLYNFVLEDVDELVKVIFGYDGSNPVFFFSGMKESALAILNESNRHQIFPL
jgi:hypothetical protein